jgi:FMN-dependent oxidoreductase (nitrilotriacetate monooxygenase family)
MRDAIDDGAAGLGGRHIRFNVNLLPGPLSDPSEGVPGVLEHPNRAHPFVDIERYVVGAKLAESALVDAIFLADALAVAPEPAAGLNWALDPLTIHSALARETEYLGLIATASTTYSAPYALARAILSIDHISGGRAGWNIVTTMDPAAAANFGASDHPERAERYRRAAEFTQVVTALWRSWSDSLEDPWDPLALDAVAINHRGEYYEVAGPMQLPASRQGMPVLFQAGGSDEGLELAAQFVDGVFVVGIEESGTRRYRERLRQRAHQLRGVDVNVLPGVGMTVGSTDEESARLLAEAEAAIPVVRLERMALRYGIDPDTVDLEAPLASELFSIDATREVNPFARSVGFARGGIDLASAGPLTLRRFIALGGGGHRRVFGTPEGIAADLIGWVARGAADGFNISGWDLAGFAEHVVPELQRLGVHRREYLGTTLREHIRQDQGGIPATASEGTRRAA